MSGPPAAHPGASEPDEVPVTEPLRVSFVVLSCNSARVLERCIRSLAAQAAPGQRDEIWVVDNGSTDGSPELLRALASELPTVVKPLFCDTNRGTTVSRNMALRRAAGRYIGIVDSDVEAPPGTVDRLIATLESRERAGLVAPRLVYPGGRLQLSVDRFPTLTHKAKRFLALRAMERRVNREPPPGGVREVDYAISAFWLFRRDLLDRVGLLDERIFYAPEDVDYCLRIWKRGYSVLYDANVHAVHDAQEISRGAPIKKIAFRHIAGLFYLFRKHGYLLSRRRVYRAIQRARAHAAPAGHG
jgi:GT2 family glycosyltransferase